jgi:hypothetical protein
MDRLSGIRGRTGTLDEFGSELNAKNRVQFRTDGADAEFLNGTNVNVSGTNFAKGNDRLWRRQVSAVWRGFVQHEPVDSYRGIGNFRVV